MAEPLKRALIVVDVQNDFCPDGSLAVANGDQVVDPLNKKIREFLAKGEPVFKSRDWHPPETKHFKQYGGIWPVHCVRETAGAAFHPELIDDPRIQIVSKGLGDTDCYSAFDETDLEQQLNSLGVTDLEIGGLATDYCVKETVLAALNRGFRVHVDLEAVRAVDLNHGDGERALDEMRSMGAEID